MVVEKDTLLYKISNGLATVKSKVRESRENVNEYFKEKYHVVDVKLDNKFETLENKLDAVSYTHLINHLYLIYHNI